MDHIADTGILRGNRTLLRILLITQELKTNYYEAFLMASHKSFDFVADRDRGPCAGIF